MITIKDFQKIKLTIGKIIKVEIVPDSNKLYKLLIDIGDKKIQSIAGLRDYYSIEELENKLVTVIINLEPAIIRGVKSEGMMLAAQYKNTVKLLVPDCEINVGSEIK